MLAQPVTKFLRLPSLTIEGFRGIKALSIPRLGRVTLISGMNGVGKSTVLEAIQLYATHGNPSIIQRILRAHNELIPIIDEDGDEVSAPDLVSLFHGRLISKNPRASIGILGSTGYRLAIQVDASQQEFQGALFESEYPDDAHEIGLRVEFQGAVEKTPLNYFLHTNLMRRVGIARARSQSIDRNSSPIACEFLGPSVLDNQDIDRMWNKVALTANETSAVESLRLVYGNEIKAVAIVGGPGPNFGLGNRYPIVKIDGHDRPVPLRSLGDGATRIFGVALALANSEGGFLVIDEAENGIHHSVQRDFWRMVIRTAQENDVQVIATTHSWDCVVGFGEALRGIEEEAGLLIHLSRYRDSIRATEYAGEDLQTAIRQGTEVR